MIQEYKREFDKEWDFRNSNTKEYTHIYHNYPAMMIPQIARKLIKEYGPTDNKIKLIFDPYMGSGTTLVEAKICNINSIGTDINPLARLIAKAKVTNYETNTIIEKLNFIKNEINKFDKNSIPNTNNNITNPEFWYNKDNIAELNFLTSIIEKFDSSFRDFFKISLSECIREVSFTRNSEFKRYRMEEEKIPNFKPNTFKLFIEKVERNLDGLKEFNKHKSETSADIYSFNTVTNIPHEILKPNSVDLIVTSPPYGDSRTTVAYGQFSRWANEWFNFENAKDLDKYLMGGQKVKEFIVETESIKTQLNEIRTIDEKRYLEVMYFLDDYYKSITNVSKLIRKGGRVCYVVGNRTVKGVQIPLDYFTAETFERNGFKHLHTFVRGIPNKRMPSKTSPSNKKGVNVSTMMNEFIVILEKK